LSPSAVRPREVVAVNESENVLADFMGTFAAEGTWEGTPVDGRVLLNPEQLVLVGPETKESFPLSRVVDISPQQVPQEYSQYFNDSIVVAFQSSDGGPPLAVTIEADGGAIDQFGTLLFKTQLQKTTVLLKHPARVGGRVTGEGFGTATLYLADDGVMFRNIETPFRVPLDSVVGFGRPERAVQGTDRRVLSLRHVQRGKTMTTELDIRSKRRRNLLGRFLRMEYSSRHSEIADLELSPTEKELLVALHSGGEAANLAKVLDVDPSQVSMLLNGLEDDGLIKTADDGVHLTSKGRIALGEHLEDINQ
jgi:helix-turn-helix protein